MDHYVDIDLRPDPEFPAHQLMSALYAKLHRALAALADGGIGVSFPGVNVKATSLGTRLRLHGDLAGLSALLAGDWLRGMRDHVGLAQPVLVPAGILHRCVRRVQVKSSPGRLRRRLMRRHNIDEAEALLRMPDDVVRLTSLPFVQLRSNGSGHAFHLFIDHGPLVAVPVSGGFNAYGLSLGATIPWF